MECAQDERTDCHGSRDDRTVLPTTNEMSGRKIRKLRSQTTRCCGKIAVVKLSLHIRFKFFFFSMPKQLQEAPVPEGIRRPQRFNQLLAVVIRGKHLCMWLLGQKHFGRMEEEQ